MDKTFKKRYYKMMEGETSEFSIDELIYLENYLDYFKINTIMVQKSGIKDSFYCRVDSLTILYYRKNKILKHQRLVEAIKNVQGKRQENG